jgi:ParB family chromosome partitioning protein
MESVEYKEVPLEHIIVGPYNLRGENAHKSPSIKLLADSIWEDGLLHLPGVIANGDGTVTLVYGHRRYWAIEQYLKEAMPRLPVRIIPQAQANELTAIRMAITENVIRKSLNPIELAKKLLALRNAGFTNREIADEMGFETEGAITDVIKLLSLELEVQDGLMDGSLAMGHGKALLKLLRSPDLQSAAIQQLGQLTKKERTVRRLEGIVNALLSGQEQTPLPLTLPEAVKQQELADSRYRVIIEFGTVSELLAALTYILEHNSGSLPQYSAGNQEPDGQVT